MDLLGEVEGYQRVIKEQGDKIQELEDKLRKY